MAKISEDRCTFLLRFCKDLIFKISVGQNIKQKSNYHNQTITELLASFLLAHLLLEISLQIITHCNVPIVYGSVYILRSQEQGNFRSPPPLFFYEV